VWEFFRIVSRFAEHDAVDLGRPLGRYSAVPGVTYVYSREFERGFVFVNVNETKDFVGLTFPGGRSCREITHDVLPPQAFPAAQSFDLKSHHARIFLK
jgi:hypothetical protein